MKDTILRGSEAELLVASKLVGMGCQVFMPLSHKTDYDLIVDLGLGNLRRIQVKRAYCSSSGRTGYMCIETRRIIAKHSGNKLVETKRYAKYAFDYLVAVDVKCNMFWTFPIKKVLAYKAQLYLGEDKRKYEGVNVK